MQTHPVRGSRTEVRAKALTIFSGSGHFTSGRWKSNASLDPWLAETIKLAHWLAVNYITDIIANQLLHINISRSFSRFFFTNQIPIPQTKCLPLILLLTSVYFFGVLHTKLGVSYASPFRSGALHRTKQEASAFKWCRARDLGPELDEFALINILLKTGPP